MLLFATLAAFGLTACRAEDGVGNTGPTPSGDSASQIQGLIAEMQKQTQNLNADASWALICESLQAKGDLKVIRDNMEGFRNIGTAAPQVSNLVFTSVTANGRSGEAYYSYTQVFRGETKTVKEAVKVAYEKGKWCIKEQVPVSQS